MDKDQAAWCARKQEKNRSHDKRGEQSLSTCSKTQCLLLKTVEGGISLEWAKSRLQGIRDREMKAPGNGGSGGWEASPGELPGTERIPTKQDVLKNGLDPMLLISQQKVQDIYSGGRHVYVSAAGRRHAHGLQKRSQGHVQERRQSPFPAAFTVEEICLQARNLNDAFTGLVFVMTRAISMCMIVTITNVYGWVPSMWPRLTSTTRNRFQKWCGR